MSQLISQAVYAIVRYYFSQIVSSMTLEGFDPGSFQEDSALKFT